MTNRIILTDADNTLWDTDSVFVNAQLELLSFVEVATGKQCMEGDRLAFVRRNDQAIAHIHHAHLKYPPSMLVSALAIALGGVDSEKAADSVVRGRLSIPPLDQSVVDLAVQGYLAMLSKMPDLLPTVADGILTAHQAGLTVYVLTEGKIEKQKKILSHHSLDGLVAGIFEVAKNQTQFERLRQRFAPAEVVVIGDQPDRDIVPARAANCMTILIPGRFRPKWHSQEQWHEAHYVASTFNEAIAWIVNGPRK